MGTSSVKSYLTQAADLPWIPLGDGLSFKPLRFLPGHYGFMAALSYSVLALGILSSLRPDGWRLTAWAAGLLPAVLGITS